LVSVIMVAVLGLMIADPVAVVSASASDSEESSADDENQESAKGGEESSRPKGTSKPASPSGIGRGFFEKFLNRTRSSSPNSEQQQQQQLNGGDFKSVREYWERTFDDIRNLGEGRTTNATTAASASSGLSAPRRFEGFLSWDRLLQDWSDDVQEYLRTFEEETGGEYPSSTYGWPTPSSTTTKTEEGVSDFNATATAVEGELAADVNGTGPAVGTADVNGYYSEDEEEEAALGPVAAVEAAVGARASALPVPAPARPGEEVLPHTDLRDKSKSVWIVTTAALPWRTGTAVNPLLRAAYLCRGRREAGGSVTIMLPWLERPEDQINVYGAGDDGRPMFENPEDQEAFIRDWLRESANLHEAAEELNIMWYTAWQNKVENSIYSMGDITALIPSEDVDICILEEPEHLNWCVCPSWIHIWCRGTNFRCTVVIETRG